MKVLLVAKAPVAGQVKTRLGARIGHDAAADLAAAALLDTIDVCREAGAQGHLSLSGDLCDAVEGKTISAALDGWTISPQRGDTFAERLVHAHAEAGPGPVVQIGMDTPHVTAAALTAVTEGLAEHDAVLGPAATPTSYDTWPGCGCRRAAPVPTPVAPSSWPVARSARRR